MAPMRTTLVATVLLLAAATFGCGPSKNRPPASAVTPCSGQRFLEVHNALNTAVDVYGYGTISGGPTFLGNVSAGATDRIPIDNVGYVYAQVGQRRLAPSARGQAGSVTFNRLCESDRGAP